jgi:glutamate--cysteine ligase
MRLTEDRVNAPDRFTEVAAETFIPRTCFKTGPPRAVGIELEWLLVDRADPRRPLHPTDLAAVRELAPGLQHSRLTLEPGGQVELSSTPAPDPGALRDQLALDLAHLRSGIGALGLRLAATGLDPHRPSRRLLDEPRYEAMERYFDRDGSAGRTMMTRTAAIQINVDAGFDAPTAGQVDLATRWALAHALTPVLVAAFANSPVLDGRPTRLRNSRHAVWLAIDPRRTRPAAVAGLDPREAWLRYALAAPVMCIRTEAGPWLVPAALTLADWLRGRGPRPICADDVTYHLTTLFPPVRPRGHLELRSIDAQRTDADWVAALGLVWTLLSVPRAADAARAALEPLAADPDVVERAMRDGLSDPALARAAGAIFAAAIDACAGPGIGDVRAELEGFAERYVERGRCPADDTLAEFQAAASAQEEPCPAIA